jgi:glycosyltransferase involved in cell wall biosynthesis
MTAAVDDVSVIICAYRQDRWNELIAAVESVQRQTLVPGEIIVVIDHNADLHKRVEEEVAGVIVVENTQERGLSGARNSGIVVARGKVIAFLDDDAIAMPGWLESLNESFSAVEVFGCGGPVIPLWLEGEPGWLPREFYWVVGCTYRGMVQTIGGMRNPIGANMCFRREVFDSIGGFRSGIGRVGTRPSGCEETELCLRIRKHWPRHVLCYQPDARVLHSVASNRTSLRYFCRRCFAEGLSKAAVTNYVGFKGSLETEYNYILYTLPEGFLKGLFDGFFLLESRGFLRAGAIVIGLTLTVVGYLVGSISQLAISCKGKPLR